MPKIHKQHGYEIRQITSPDRTLRMSFAPALGGLGLSMIYETAAGPREMFWLNDTFWQDPANNGYGGFPLLFPNCGRQERCGIPEAYQYNGRYYYLPIHGFASRMPWDVISHEEHSLCMRLEDTHETQEKYPFAFEVTLQYTLHNDMFICRQTYTNRGTAAMPYTAGFHPYFATPPPGAGKDACHVNFDAELRYIYNDQQTDLVAVAPALLFPASLSSPEINETLHRIPEKTRSCAHLSLENSLGVTLEAYGEEDDAMFPYMQLFTQEEAPFFCIEPWTGIPNGLNSMDQCRWLQPDQTEKAVFRMSLHS